MNETTPSSTDYLSKMSLGLNPRVRLVKEGDHGYLYDHENANVQVANSTALLILELCNKENTLNDIIDTFSTLFPNIPKTKVETDITAFITDLVERGVVVPL
jgi:hypothetical protein